MATFEDPTTDSVEALFATGAITTADTARLLQRVDQGLGAFSGQFMIDGHETFQDADLGPLGTQDVVEVDLTARYANSTEPVAIGFAVIDDQLEMIGWHIGT